MLARGNKSVLLSDKIEPRFKMVTDLVRGVAIGYREMNTGLVIVVD